MTPSKGSRVDALARASTTPSLSMSHGVNVRPTVPSVSMGHPGKALPSRSHNPSCGSHGSPEPAMTSKRPSRSRSTVAGPPPVSFQDTGQPSFSLTAVAVVQVTIPQPTRTRNLATDRACLTALTSTVPRLAGTRNTEPLRLDPRSSRDRRRRPRR